MHCSLVILTGASGSGKTTLARAIQAADLPECEVFFFDSIGIPTPEKMKEFGDGYQPGGAWQRAMTFQWLEKTVGILETGKSVLLEGQMRIAFIQEAILATKVTAAHVILVDCDDATRVERLRVNRGQPELAHAQMMGWANYLREEAVRWNTEILDTGVLSQRDCIEILGSYL